MSPAAIIYIAPTSFAHVAMPTIFAVKSNGSETRFGAASGRFDLFTGCRCEDKSIQTDKIVGILKGLFRMKK